MTKPILSVQLEKGGKSGILLLKTSPDGTIVVKQDLKHRPEADGLVIKNEPGGFSPGDLNNFKNTKGTVTVELVIKQ